MRTSSRANEPAGAARPIAARRAAIVAAALLIDGYATGCSGCRRQHDAGFDARPVAHDGADLDSGPGGDAGLPSHDGGEGPDAGSSGDAAVAMCPPWRPPVAAGHGWLYLRALSTSGAVLTPGGNHVDVYVRRVDEPLPGERADADDPCAVASYDQTAPKVRVLVAAIGFSSQEREISPQACLETSPCSLELPQSLEPRYYRATAATVSLRVASDVPQADQVNFAAAVAGDALARSKALGRPLAAELDRAATTTNVPAVDLAIHYTESRLRKKCDASCLEEPSVDPAVRGYLKGVRRPAHSSPFELRTPPARWKRP
jgi:hypothetical protein